MDIEETWNKSKFVDFSYCAKSVECEGRIDGIIEIILRICGPQNKFCVDVGANNGRYLSNTWNLINNWDWASVQIEWPDVSKGYAINTYKKLKEYYKDNSKVTTLDTKIEIDNLDEVLDKVGNVPTSFDFLSIDIDSYDYEVWKNLKRYKPNMVIIECNIEIGNKDVDFYDPTCIKGGVSLFTLNKLAKEKGYEFICADSCNALYIRNEFINNNIRI